MDDREDVGTFAGRLATFARPHHFNKRRASAASKKKVQTTVTWPHETPSPEDLSNAGFYYKPSQEYHDSVTCFLCGKTLDGWDPNDDPAIEHLSHVPDCGWAINACIERRSQDMDRVEEDPLSERIMESRRATFRNVWPHEGKKGWKCKLQKMVEAGWCYNPLPEADDCVQCFYCGCSLDGWEPKDDPWEEHRKRAPDCPFFALVEESKASSKTSKAGKGRQSRASKASRASTQSNVTIVSEEPPLDLDDSLPADDDTVITTASTTSKATKGRKKAVKGKAPPKKARGGQSQLASTVDDSVVSDVDVSNILQSKTRSTRAQQPTIDEIEATLEPSEAPPKKTRGRKKAAAIQSEIEPAPVPEEDNATFDSCIETSAVPFEQPKTRAKKPIGRTAEIIVESGEADQEKPSTRQIGRKASRIKAPKADPHPATDSGDIQNSVTAASDQAPRTRGKKRTSDGAEKIDSSVVSVDNAPAVAKQKAKAAPPKRGRAASRATKQSAQQEVESASALNRVDDTVAEAKQPEKILLVNKDTTNIEIATESSSKEVSEPGQEENAKGTGVTGPPKPAKGPTNHSPTGSPQSSDAENRRPSSRLSLLKSPVTHKSPEPQRLPLKPSTPRGSPAKRIINGGLNTNVPWTPVDLEHIFLPSPSSRRIASEDKENVTAESIAVCMTSAEKKMKVEEWILWNAAKAEERLKGECERLIGAFEGEGVRALRALEGIEAI